MTAIRILHLLCQRAGHEIRRKADNASLFEGKAKARSRTDNLGKVVPSLVQAMFTGFPGNSGETVKITIPPEPKQANAY